MKRKCSGQAHSVAIRLALNHPFDKQQSDFFKNKKASSNLIDGESSRGTCSVANKASGRPATSHSRISQWPRNYSNSSTNIAGNVFLYMSKKNRW